MGIVVICCSNDAVPRQPLRFSPPEYVHACSIWEIEINHYQIERLRIQRRVALGHGGSLCDIHVPECLAQQTSEPVADIFKVFYQQYAVQGLHLWNGICTAR